MGTRIVSSGYARQGAVNDRAVTSMDDITIHIDYPESSSTPIVGPAVIAGWIAGDSGHHAPTILVDGQPTAYRCRWRAPAEDAHWSAVATEFLVLVRPTLSEHLLEIRVGDTLRRERLLFDIERTMVTPSFHTTDWVSQPGLVSIVTTFLNGREFFEEAQNSVFAQTYADWEWLLVDDGSSDGSTELAKDLEARFPARIRYLCHAGHQNRGMSASRNVGLRHARGEFLGLLDVDDIYLPDKLAVQTEVLRRHPECAMVYGPLHFWYSWGGREEDRQYEFVCRNGPESDVVVAPPTQVLRALDTMNGLPGSCSMLLRSAAARSVGGFVETFPGMYEDEAFFSKICSTYSVYLLPSSHDRYRQHPNSCCAQAEKRGDYIPGQQNRSRYRFLCWLHDYARNRKLRDMEHVLDVQLKRYGDLVGGADPER
jgi:glycosyltransferase involved in cell wall biosynthesis